MFNNLADIDLEVTHLLVISGFLKPHDLDKALAGKRDGGSRLMDTLLDGGSVDAEVWKAAHDVLTHIHKSRLPVESARPALYMVGNCRMSVQEAFSKLGFQASGNPWLNQLTLLAESKKWGEAS